MHSKTKKLHTKTYEPWDSLKCKSTHWSLGNESVHRICKHYLYSAQVYHPILAVSCGLGRELNLKKSYSNQVKNKFKISNTKSYWNQVKVNLRYCFVRVKKQHTKASSAITSLNGDGELERLLIEQVSFDLLNWSPWL